MDRGQSNAPNENKCILRHTESILYVNYTHKIDSVPLLKSNIINKDFKIFWEQCCYLKQNPVHTEDLWLQWKLTKPLKKRNERLETIFVHLCRADQCWWYDYSMQSPYQSPPTNNLTCVGIISIVRGPKSTYRTICNIQILPFFNHQSWSIHNQGLTLCTSAFPCLQ